MISHIISGALAASAVFFITFLIFWFLYTRKPEDNKRYYFALVNAVLAFTVLIGIFIYSII